MNLQRQYPGDIPPTPAIRNAPLRLLQALSQETEAFTGITSFSFLISTFSAAGVVGPFAPSAITCEKKTDHT